MFNARSMVAVSFLLVAFACGGDSDSDGDGVGVGVDAGDQELDAAIDAPTSTSNCNAPGDCACFSNHDCPATHACTSLDDTGENVWCLEGPRGTGALGDPCTDETSCSSALCVEDDSGSFCSDLCDEDNNECPAVLPRCLFIGFGVDESICAPT